MDTPRTINPRQLEARRRGGSSVHLIDVRSPDEYRDLHADLAMNIPLNRLDPARVRRLCQDGQPLYIIGRQETRGRQAYERLLASGCDNVVQVEGGTEAWEQAGLPVVRGKKRSRSRWLVMGLLLTVILVLGWLIHPVVGILLALAAADWVLGDLAERHP